MAVFLCLCYKYITAEKHVLLEQIHRINRSHQHVNFACAFFFARYIFRLVSYSARAA